MNFYKLICIIAIVVLIISLTSIAVAIQTSSKNVMFPPNVSECPDFYIKNKRGQCTPTFPLSTKRAGCDKKSFTAKRFNNPGMGPTSGMCAKKKWAQHCKVNWDGITNNSSVCYQTNE